MNVCHKQTCTGTHINSLNRHVMCHEDHDMDWTYGEKLGTPGPRLSALFVAVLMLCTAALAAASSVT